VSLDAAAYFPDALGSAAEVDVPASASSPVIVQPNSGSAAPLVATNSPLRESSDEELLVQVGKGSKEALSLLFQRHARPVFNVARRILRDDSEAEDLVQELFLFLFQKACVFDAAKGSAASWIIQMTYYRAIDRRRYLNARHHYRAEELNEERQHATFRQPSISEVAAQALLHKLRGGLSAEQLRTLELHFFEGYTFHEIAEKTGQTFGSVRNHYYRGLERLRSHIFPGKVSPK
jgi:RNA polymerase sigma-70 factor (ECF subfamily)